MVDESYIDFTPDPVGWSVLGCEVPNIVVLRSTTKFYGIAATRTGIAWCTESEPLAYLFGQQENWGLSGVDVRVACAAVRDVAWSDRSRAQMHADNAWLAETLSGVVGFDLCANKNVHFQYAFCKRSAEVAEAFAKTDPYVLNGLVTRWHVREWTTVVGESAATPVRPACDAKPR